MLRPQEAALFVFQVSCTPDKVEEAVSRIATHKLDLYQGGDARPIGLAIEALFAP